MPTYIMKLHDDEFNKDYYLEWSTVVDAPVTYGLPLKEFKDDYKKRYGKNDSDDLEERLKRVELKGISDFPPYDELEDYFDHNRAGYKEHTLSKEGLLEKYCRNHGNK